MTFKLVNPTTHKILATAALSALLAFTAGCSNKRADSQVSVSPLGMYGDGYIDGGNYNGGAAVANGADVLNAASSMQSVVYFGYDQSDITSEAAAILDQHAALLSSNQGASVLVAGHTDERGGREYNMALGERRAMAVRSYLEAQGINPESIQIISYGEEQPAANGTTDADYAQNRRAELSY